MINCAGQIQTITSNIICDNGASFLSGLAPSATAAFFGALFSFLFILLHDKLNTNLKHKKELKGVLNELDDWCFSIQNSILGLKGHIRRILENGTTNSLLPILKNIPLRNDLFTKLPLEEFNPLPKELSLFQIEILKLNHHIDDLNQKCTLFNQMVMVKAGGGDVENVGVAIHKEWTDLAKELGEEIENFSPKLRAVLSSFGMYKNKYD
jgi:hypothetical protein